jgi:hypothetical protein
MMRKLGCLVVVVVVLAGIGWYRGWFRATVENADGKRTVEFQIDKAKLQQDATRAETRAKELVPK